MMKRYNPYPIVENGSVILKKFGWKPASEVLEGGFSKTIDIKKEENFLGDSYLVVCTHPSMGDFESLLEKQLSAITLAAQGRQIWFINDPENAWHEIFFLFGTEKELTRAFVNEFIRMEYSEEKI